MNISFIGLLLIAGVAFVAVAAVVLLGLLIGLANKNSPKLIWLAAPMLILVVMAPMLLWVKASRQSSPDFRANTAFAGEEAHAQIGPDSFRQMPSIQTPIISKTERPPLAWDESVRGKVNVYPGIADCGKQFARLLAKDLDREAELTYHIEFAFDDPISIQAQFGAGFIEELNGLLANKPFATWTSESKKTGSTKVSGFQPDEQNNLDATRVAVQCQHKTPLLEPSKYGLTNQQGTIYCSWKKEGGEKNNAASFDYETKPWLTETKQFVVQDSRYQWLIGRSQRLAKSPEEAAADAFSNVNTQLLASNRLSIKTVFDSQEMMERNVADRFVQKISMPYGDVWREAVLICLDPPSGINGLEARPNAIVSNASTSSAAGRGRYANPSNTVAAQSYLAPISPESALAMLAGFVVLIGWVSNLLTQGYYRQQVNTTTVLAVGLIASVLAAIVMMFVVS